MLELFIIFILVCLGVGAFLALPLGIAKYASERDCPHCRTRISKKATVCPQCKRDIEPAQNNSRDSDGELRREYQFKESDPSQENSERKSSFETNEKKTSATIWIPITVVIVAAIVLMALSKEKDVQKNNSKIDKVENVKTSPSGKSIPLDDMKPQIGYTVLREWEIPCGNGNGKGMEILVDSTESREDVLGLERSIRRRLEGYPCFRLWIFDDNDTWNEFLHALDMKYRLKLSSKMYWRHFLVESARTAGDNNVKWVAQGRDH